MCCQNFPCSYKSYQDYKRLNNEFCNGKNGCISMPDCCPCKPDNCCPCKPNTQFGCPCGTRQRCPCRPNPNCSGQQQCNNCPCCPPDLPQPNPKRECGCKSKNSFGFCITGTIKFREDCWPF